MSDAPGHSGDGSQAASPIDQAHFSPALLGFYASCAAIAAGAAMFFFALFVLTKAGYGALPTGLKTVGIILVVIGVPGAFVCLHRARRPDATTT